MVIKGEIVAPKSMATILGVIMDLELRYKQHMANMATRGFRAAKALKRLQIVPLDHPF